MAPSIVTTLENGTCPWCWQWLGRTEHSVQNAPARCFGKLGSTAGKHNDTKVKLEVIGWLGLKSTEQSLSRFPDLPCLQTHSHTAILAILASVPPFTRGFWAITPPVHRARGRQCSLHQLDPSPKDPFLRSSRHGLCWTHSKIAGRP